MEGVRFFFIIMLLTLISKPLLAEGVTEEQASNILQSHFVRLLEVKDIYQGLPEKLPINFSEEVLKRNRGAWLMPLKIDSSFEYILFRTNFENEIYSLGYKQVDTIDLREAEKILAIIKRIRPWFPGRDESATPFKYFFRTRDGDKIKNTAISYDGKKFITVDIPKGVELAMMDKDYISYLTRNKEGVEIQFEATPSPPNYLKKREQQSIFFLTLFYSR